MRPLLLFTLYLYSINFAFAQKDSQTVDTATAFSIATIFASMYKDKPLIGIVSYSLASMVGISRLTEHAHWASDVFADGV
jgi:hypothetical protein